MRIDGWRRWCGAIAIFTLGATAIGCESQRPHREIMNAPEHAVIVHFTYGSTDLTRLFALEDQLERAIAAAEVGEFDGNEVAADGSDGYLYMYGPDADRLFAAVRVTLESAEFMRGARVTLRYGPPQDGIKEVEIELGTK